MAQDKVEQALQVVDPAKREFLVQAYGKTVRLRYDPKGEH